MTKVMLPTLTDIQKSADAHQQQVKIHNSSLADQITNFVIQDLKDPARAAALLRGEKLTLNVTDLIIDNTYFSFEDLKEEVYQRRPDNSMDYTVKSENRPANSMIGPRKSYFVTLQIAPFRAAADHGTQST